MRSWIVGVLPFDGGSDGVTCSAKQVTSDLTGVWVGEGRKPSPTLMSTFSTALPFCGSRIHWIWKAASSLRGFGAEMSSRTRLHPVFTSVIWENGAHPFFRENKRENGTKTQCFGGVKTT